MLGTPLNYLSIIIMVNSDKTGPGMKLGIQVTEYS